MYKRKKEIFCEGEDFMEILIRNVAPEELNVLDKEGFNWEPEDETYTSIVIIGEDKDDCNAALHAIGRPLMD